MKDTKRAQWWILGALLAVFFAFALTGCSAIAVDRGHQIIDEASNTIDQVEGLVDHAGKNKTESAITQICERMRVRELYEEFAGRMDVWAELCNRPKPPEVSE